MADLEALADRLSRLTVLEAAELSRMLEDNWGVSASAPAITVVPDMAPAVEAVEQTEFSVILSGVDPTRKINVIKEIRSITNLGLKEAKEFTEAAGPTKIVKDSLTHNEATALKKRLDEAGGVAMIE